MRQPIPFGKYYLLERVNVGGMAEVFKAKAIGVEGFERLVAVKRILPSIAEDEEFITMFIDEAKIAVQLTHANVAQIFDLGKVDDSYFIALEYVHGKDLRAMFNRARARGEQLPVPLCCYVIMKLCEGLDYAHNKRDAGGSFLNLVHRDVSPQNILCSYEGEVKIIDFGIAKAAGKAGRTQAGILKGKFGYMSPEQVQGLEIDRRSDVFGVGICLYEMLTGERLFVGESDFATLEKVRNVDIMPPSTYNRRFPEELEQIVLKALARDRNLRHQTAMQLHDELQGFMYGSGNFFGRRDLSMYMHRAFAEEIQRESARDQEYGAAGGVTSGGEREDVTGLTAFEEIDPVSTVSALNEQPLAAAPRTASPAQGYRQQQQPARGMAAPASSPNRPLKSTLLGLPTAPGGPVIRPQTSPGGRAGPQVPPLVPRPQSIPPGVAPAAPQPRLDMDWDDEEMSTQIYDRADDGRTVPVSAGPLAAPIISQHASPISGSFPPALAQPTMLGMGQPMQQAMPMQQGASMSRPPGAFGAPIGAPSPFAYEPEPQYRERRPSTADVSWPPPGTAQKKPMVMAAVSVVVILALIVVALLFFRTPTPGALHVSTVPPDVSVTVDGMPQSGPSPFVIPSVVPGVPHEVVISKDGYRAWSGKVELQPDQTLALPPVVLELLESGFTLDSVPSGAQVSVDGRPLDRRTPVRVTDLTPGDHQIRLESDGFSRWESSLHVTPGTVLDLPTAQLTTRTEEGAAGVVAAAAAAAAPPAAAPAAAPIAAAAAATPTPTPTPTRAAPRRPRPAPQAQTFAPPPVAAAPTPPPDEEPEEEPAGGGGGGTGTLRVQTRPWSKVSVDGRYVGNTPLMGLELSSGKHTLTFINEEFSIRKTVRVQIQAGQVTTQVLTLTE